MQININQVHLKSLVRDLGTLLRSARLRNGISLDRAAFLMKVPREKVFLLEEGNLNAWDNKRLVHIVNWFNVYNTRLKLTSETFEPEKESETYLRLKELKYQIYLILQNSAG